MATYYLNTSGSDAASGLVGAPWQTLEKLQTELDAGNIVSGDEIRFQDGQKFIGKITLSPSISGVTFTRTNDGPEKPEISGEFDMSSLSWSQSSENSNIKEASLTGVSDLFPRMLFRGENRMHPKDLIGTIESVTKNTKTGGQSNNDGTVTSSIISLLGQNAVGLYAVGGNKWVKESREILSVSGSTATLRGDAKAMTSNSQSGTTLWIEGVKSELTQEHDFAIDYNQGVFCYYTTESNPVSSHGITGIKEENLFN